MCRRTCYHIIIKGSSSLYLWWSDDLLQARIYGYYSVERNQGKTSKNLRIQGYNSKIVSANKAEREEDLKLDQSYLGFRHIVDTALIPLCNTRFIKGHKPSNHIRARIMSHVYTIEWTVYHNTYHVKRYNKMNTNVIYYINEKMSDTAEAKYKYDKRTLRSWAGRHRDVDCETNA